MLRIKALLLVYCTVLHVLEYEYEYYKCSLSGYQLQ